MNIENLVEGYLLQRWALFRQIVMSVQKAIQCLTHCSICTGMKAQRKANYEDFTFPTANTSKYKHADRLRKTVVRFE